MRKGAGGVSIIGGADGPTSIFIAGKGGKVKLKTRITSLIEDEKVEVISLRQFVMPYCTNVKRSSKDSRQWAFRQELLSFTW